MAKRRGMTVYINGERWKIRFCRLRGKYGDCDYDSRTIRIHDTLTGTELMDVLIHELVHARWPDLLKSAVEEFAGIITHALDLLGFRMEDDNGG